MSVFTKLAMATADLQQIVLVQTIHKIPPESYSNEDEDGAKVAGAAGADLNQIKAGQGTSLPHQGPLAHPPSLQLPPSPSTIISLSLFLSLTKLLKAFF